MRGDVVYMVFPSGLKATPPSPCSIRMRCGSRPGVSRSHTAAQPLVVVRVLFPAPRTPRAVAAT